MKGIFLLGALIATTAVAQVEGKDIEYKDGGAALEGYLAAQAGDAKRPGVIVVHDWTGVDDYEKGRAKQLAEMGFVALAADIYGKGIRPTAGQAAGAEAGKYKADRKLFRSRLQAALDTLKADPRVDPERIVAIGYCFGGTAVLELARMGAPLKGVVSFHGALDTPTPEDAKNIKAKVLVLHGGDDPFVPPAQVEAFMKEMRDANVDWQLVAYGGAVHSFTEPGAGSNKGSGAAYHEAADRRSWQDMKQFFHEVIGGEGLKL